MMDITYLIQWLVVVVLALAGTWLGVKIVETMKDLPRDARWVLDGLIEAGVQAAEQRFMLDEDASGKTKFDYAYAFIRAACGRYGVKWDDAIIAPLIEAKVYELFNSAKSALD